MPLIRARDAESKIAQAEVLRFQDVEAEAGRVLAEARQQAEVILVEARAIMAEAKVRAERLRAEGHKIGLDAGRTEGLRIGQELGCKQALEQAKADFAAKHAGVVKVLTAALEQFEARRRGLLSEMERDAVALAGAIAHRVIKRAVAVDPACVLNNLREALQLIAQRNQLEIRLDPQDLAQARQFAGEFLPAQESEAVRFLADASVGSGGVVLRTAGGQIDATIETQWNRILEEILAGWQAHWLLSPATLTPPPVSGGAAPGEAAAIEDEPSFVEILQDEQAPPEAAEAAAMVPPAPAEPEAAVEVLSADAADADIAPVAEVSPDAAMQQALIDEALAEALRAMSPPPAAAPAARDAERPNESAIVEEIDPSEVEKTGPNDAAE